MFVVNRVAGVIALSAVLTVVGCGGGGGGGEGASQSVSAIVAAKQIGPNTFQINPGASWKPSPSSDFYIDSLASVDLALLNNGQVVPAGRVLEVKSAGMYYFDVRGSFSNVATGLLVNASGLALAPGSGSTVSTSSASTECSQAVLLDTIPEDFTIPNDVVATFVVPEGAAALRLSVADCFYKDNSIYGADPIRVTITLK